MLDVLKVTNWKNDIAWWSLREPAENGTWQNIYHIPVGAEVTHPQVKEVSGLTCICCKSGMKF
jgi:hypothetical protein